MSFLLNALLSSARTKFSQFAWLFIPSLFLYIALFFAYQAYPVQLGTWLKGLYWLNYTTMAIATVIGLQFGRSRLVYCCLILLLYVPTTDKHFAGFNDYSDIRTLFAVLAITWLMFTKDRGFSWINTLNSAAVLCLLAGVSWFTLSLLPEFIPAQIDTLSKLLQAHLHEISELAPTQMLLIYIGCVLISVLKLIYQANNNHNALFCALLLIAPLHVTHSNTFLQLILLFLACLFCYAVIKDSFTMAFKDELTNIPSRRALMQYIQTLGRKYAVVMGDIDHFKKFNDTYGHDVGDEVLKLVASKLHKVSGGGKTFRFGGEEFVIVFRGKDAEQVVPYIELVREVIANYDIALRAKPRPAKAPNKSKNKPAKDKIVKVTTSFGIGQRTKHVSDFSQVMKQADIALYAAKKAGRNCVKVAKQ